MKKKKELSHIDRMKEELAELTKKIDKGQAFFECEMTTPKVTIVEIQRTMLAMQLEYMRGYARILDERIAGETHLQQLLELHSKASEDAEEPSQEEVDSSPLGTEK